MQADYDPLESRLHANLDPVLSSLFDDHGNSGLYAEF